MEGLSGNVEYTRVLLVLGRDGPLCLCTPIFAHILFLWLGAEGECVFLPHLSWVCSHYGLGGVENQNLKF